MKASGFRVEMGEAILRARCVLECGADTYPAPHSTPCDHRRLASPFPRPCALRCCSGLGQRNPLAICLPPDPACQPAYGAGGRAGERQRDDLWNKVLVTLGGS